MTTGHSAIVDQVKNKLIAVVGSGRLGLHEPTFLGNEHSYLQECLDSTFVSSVGPFVDRFESELVSFTGSKYAVAVVSGTAALHLSLRVAGVRAGDEVLVPALSFVATANAVSYCGAIPHFTDIEPESLGIDPVSLRKYLQANTIMRSGLCVNKKTHRVIRAIVIMHVFGHPSDIDSLLALASDFNLMLLEDAAESLGSLYKGKSAGTFGKVSALSFNGNKIVTTGGGGALLTDDRNLASFARHISTTAKIPHKWNYDHDEIGYNYRMPNLNAALGCAQIERLSELVESKRRLYVKYRDAFENVSGISVMSEPEGCKSNYWLQTLVLEPGLEQYQLDIIENLNAANIDVRPPWKLLNRLQPYTNAPTMITSTAEQLTKRLINIPSSPFLERNRNC
jgi:perosamine synthetase